MSKTTGEKKKDRTVLIILNVTDFHCRHLIRGSNGEVCIECRKVVINKFSLLLIQSYLSNSLSAFSMALPYTDNTKLPKTTNNPPSPPLGFCILKYALLQLVSWKFRTSVFYNKRTRTGYKYKRTLTIHSINKRDKENSSSLER